MDLYFWSRQRREWKNASEKIPGPNFLIFEKGIRKKHKIAVMQCMGSVDATKLSTFLPKNWKKFINFLGLRSPRRKFFEISNGKFFVFFTFRAPGRNNFLFANWVPAVSKKTNWVPAVSIAYRWKFLNLWPLLWLILRAFFVFRPHFERGSSSSLFCSNIAAGLRD